MRYSWLLLLVFILMHKDGLCQDTSSATSAVKRDSQQELIIRKIIIEGNNVTRSRVILRELSIHEGDMVAEDSISYLVDQNKLRLFNLELFNEVDQHTERTGNGIDWYIRVKERWYIIPSFYLSFADRNINTWWVQEHHDLHRIMLGLTATDRNFRGNLETLAATVQGGYTTKLGINYVSPYINKKQTAGVGFTAEYFENRQTYYNTDSNKLAYTGTYTGPVLLRQAEFGVSYLYRPHYSSKHIFRVSYKDYTVSDTIIKLNPDYFLSGSRRARFLEFFYRFEYNGVDNWNYSLKGFKLVNYIIMNTGFQGINFQGYDNVEAGVFRNPLPKWYMSVIFRGRLMYPQSQPYYFRGGLGSATDYVRGYEYYVIDGGDYGLIRFDIKREIFNNTYSLPVRYFTAVPVRVYPKIFFDAGDINSPQPGNSFLSNRLLYSGGVGLDIVTLYDIKIRLEYAWNQLGQNGLYLHFDSE